MNKILSLLRELTNDEFHHQGDKGNIITLQETQKASKCQFVPLKKGPVKTFTLALDKQNNIEIHPLLNSIENLKKKCDYIIFCQKGNTLYVLVVELKSDNSTGWTKQTRAGEMIARYLIGMIENYSGLNLTQVKFRYILFSTQNANKLKGRRKKKITVEAFKYEQDHKLGFFFTRKPCNTTYPNLDIFLR
ncbi:MAG TPA: hypothetical protein EYP59_11480 [Thiotrichaceae bacterium]|nr:hypothetical protein [Thiotrichaceae bacterium]